MTKAQHTPGPWKLGKRLPEGSISIDADDHQMLATCVWVMSDAEFLGETSPECEANAHLIAAAPELLAALEELLATAEFKGVNVWDIDAVTKSRAAISKAKGGAA